MYLECCQLESIDWENKTVQLIFTNWPTAIMGDRCSVNVKAGKAITKNLGLMSPTARCASHTSDGSFKIMLQSNTKIAEEVYNFPVTFKQSFNIFN